MVHQAFCWAQNAVRLIIIFVDLSSMCGSDSRLDNSKLRRDSGATTKFPTSNTAGALIATAMPPLSGYTNLEKRKSKK